VDPHEPIDPLLTGVGGTRLDWHQVPAGGSRPAEWWGL